MSGTPARLKSTRLACAVSSVVRTPYSIARRLITGSVPGMPWQTGHVWVFGGAPKVVGQPQNILVRVVSCAWTSRPMTTSYFIIGSPRTAGPQPREIQRSALPSRQFRAARVPVGGALVGARRAQYRRLVECLADQLKADRQTAGGEAARHRDGRHTR